MDTKFEIDEKQYFIRMTPKVIAEAKKAHAKVFAESLKDGSLLRKSLMKYMRDQGVWDDEKEEKYQTYIKKISDLEFKLSSGKDGDRKLKVSEGRALAIQLANVRAEFRDLISERNMLDTNTAEGNADNARFNYILANSVYSYDTQKLVFSSMDDYIDRGSEAESLTIAGKFANFLYGIDEKYDDNLVENKFLKRFNLIDDKGRFIDKEGKFIDVDGRPVDEDGYLLDADGKKVDLNGHSLDVNVDTAEFEID